MLLSTPRFIRVTNTSFFSMYINLKLFWGNVSTYSCLYTSYVNSINGCAKYYANCLWYKPGVHNNHQYNAETFRIFHRTVALVLVVCGVCHSVTLDTVYRWCACRRWSGWHRSHQRSVWECVQQVLDKAQPRARSLAGVKQWWGWIGVAITSHILSFSFTFIYTSPLFNLLCTP